MYLLAACLFMVGCGRVAFESSDDAGGGTAPLTSLAVTPPMFMTTSTAFVDVPGSTITVPPSPGQRWLLLVNATLVSTSLDYTGPEARYLVDGVERGLGGTEATDVAQPGPWQSLYMFDGGAAPTTIVFQARDKVGQTTTLDRLSAVVVPLATEADPIYRSVDAVTPVTTMTFVDVGSFALTPAVAGDYLLLLNAITTEAPGTSDVNSQWLDPLGNPWSTGMQNPRGGWQSQMFVRRAALPATIKFQARSGTTSTVQYVRLLALRIAGLTSFAETSHSISQTTSSTTPVLVNTLLPSLPPAPQYLVVGTIQVDDNCGNAVLNSRGAHFSVDAQNYATTFLTGNCAYEATQGYVGLHQTAPTSVTASYYSGTGEDVKYQESELFVLGVP